MLSRLLASLRGGRSSGYHRSRAMTPKFSQHTIHVSAMMVRNFRPTGSQSCHGMLWKTMVQNRIGYIR
jgi:hypothetical protein